MELDQKPALGWGTAAKIAWRELRASRAKFLFVILSVAIGVAALFLNDPPKAVTSLIEFLSFSVASQTVVSEGTSRYRLDDFRTRVGARPESSTP